MDIISAYREVGTYRGAAAISGTTPKTVKRVIARHEAGGGAPARVPRERNYDTVAGLVAGRVDKASARISAKRLLRPRGRRGMRGRRGTSAAWSRRASRLGGGIITEAAARRCGRRVSTW
jgi:hypothetical protein